MTDSDGDDDFQDAVEYLPRNDENPMHLSRAIAEAKLALDLFMNNRFEEAKALMTPWAGESMYHALGTGVFEFLEATMTFEQSHIESAAAALERSVEVCQRFRKKSSMVETIGKMVRKQNYDTLTEEEIHAELCFAECLLLRAALTFVEDENLLSFVKGGLKMRHCLNAYRQCWHILKHRTWSEESKYKCHFESGARMGIGGYNLMISLLPARIMKLLEFIGFSGNRNTGLLQLEIGNGLHGSLRQILCTMALLGYHLFVSYAIGHEEGDLELCQSMISLQLKNYPDGIWFKFFKGRLAYVQGNLDDAVKWYTRAWCCQTEWTQFHHLCYWELMWAHCLRLDWVSARDFADLLFHESRWSKVIYGYQKAAFMCMLNKHLDSDGKSELKELMRNIPSWKQRIAGKSIPMEKYIIKKSSRYFAQNDRLILPAFELLYIWNGFRILGKLPSLVRGFLALIKVEEKNVEQDVDLLFYFENIGLIMLLKGMCHRYLERPREAELCFRRVIKLAKDMKEDTWLGPYAMYELGILFWTENKLDEAVATLESAKHDYKKYPLESRLHFRIHSALVDLRGLRNINPGKRDMSTETVNLGQD